MTITPTTLIAVSGLVRGSGLQIPAELTGIVSSIQSNPLVVAVSGLTGAYTYGGITLPAVIATLPASLQPLTQMQSAASNVLTQAQSILPAGTGADPSAGIKSFMSVFNSSTAFSSASAEYAAALAQFGNKSFGDLGINMSNYQDIITNGTSSITKGFQTLALQAQQQAFGSLSGLVSPALLTSNKALFNSSFISQSMQTVGGSLKNFGSLFDFQSPASLGPKNLVSQLQKQGLADRNGINDLIYEAGYDPTNLSAVPDSVLTSVLSQIKGDDLDKILKQTGANPYQTVLNAGQLLQASNMLPPQATAILGIASKGPAAIKALGSTLSNLGTQIDNFKMSDLMAGIETKAMQYLGQIKQLIPTDVKTALAPILGAGGGLFGNPQMKDMIGSVAGIAHTASLTSANVGATALGKTQQGAALQTAAIAYQTAVQTFIDANPGADATAVAADPTVAAAAAAVISASDSLNSAINSNSGLQGLVAGINAGITTSATKLAGEIKNLGLAGLKMVDDLGTAIEQTFNKGYQTILAFGSKLHKMGRDIQNLGFNDFLPKMATSNVAGDAIRASLVEGRNVGRSSAIGQPTPIIADEKKEISTAQSGNLDSLKAAYLNAAAEADKASKDLFNTEKAKANPNGVSERFEQSTTARDQAKEAMLAAARQAGVPASELPVYKSNNKFN